MYEKWCAVLKRACKPQKDVELSIHQQHNPSSAKPGRCAAAADRVPIYHSMDFYSTRTKTSSSSPTSSFATSMPFIFVNNGHNYALTPLDLNGKP